jgi:FemAB-related protein (PEP-CTERM system-associated)
MNAPLVVRAATAADATAWDAFATASPQGTIFHRYGWRDAIERVFRHRTHYLLAERAGRIAAVLPLAEVRTRLFGHSLVSLPFCVYGGVAADEADAIPALHGAARELAEQLRVEHLELRNREVREPAWPRQDLYVTFRKALDPDPEKNLLAIPRKQRAMVRKGIQRGLVATSGRDVETFFALYADNMHRHGTPPMPKRWFAALLDAFGDAADILIVRDAAGAPVSGVLSFWFRDEVLPYYAGDFTAARDLAANDFKYWALMERAVQRGCRTFDYGRSKQGTGSFDFKKNWGFTPEPLAYEHVLVRAAAIPEHNPLNPKYRAFIAAWRRLPRPVANALGPFVVRGLG